MLERLRAGKPVLSVGVRLARSGDVVRIASSAGYQVVWIDLEHSAMPIDCAAQMAATANDLDMAAWVRVPEREYGVVGRVLDGGATGIIVPKVETAAEARLYADACRFPPRGQRSQIAILPQFGFARLPVTELNSRCNDGVVLQILLESGKGVANADEIASVDGVDMLGVGTNDLCNDLGCPGSPRHPKVLEALATVAAAARRHGKVAVAGGLADPVQVSEMLEIGFAPLIFAAIDTDVLAAGLAQRGAEWRDRLPG